jgi:hypothetical protein
LTSIADTPPNEMDTDHPHPGRPHFGYVHIGPHRLAVHATTLDHMRPQKGDSWGTRFNKRTAIWVTKNVGSMPAFWLFTVLAATVAPSCLFAGGYIGKFGFITTFGFELLATLVLSTGLELVLMPAIMVQGNMAAEVSDARAAKTFNDAEAAKNGIEKALDNLDLTTEGGMKELYDLLRSVANKVGVTGA